MREIAEKRTAPSTPAPAQSLGTSTSEADLDLRRLLRLPSTDSSLKAPSKVDRMDWRNFSLKSGPTNTYRMGLMQLLKKARLETKGIPM